RALRQYVLDESAGGDGDVELVAHVDQLAHGGSRHDGEGAAAEFEAVDAPAPGEQEVPQVTGADRRVVRPADLRDPAGARLGRAGVGAEERKRAFIIFR